MKVIIGYPPNIDQIEAIFPVKGKPGVIFTWGDTIYNPSRAELTPSLKAHEGVHFNRQTNDLAKIEKWWETYLVDEEFRLAEELPAHRAEFKAVCAQVRDYQIRANHLDRIASRLCGPMYGNLLSLAKAKSLITNGARHGR